MRQQSNGRISLGKLSFFGILMLFGNDYSNEDIYGKPYKEGNMHHILNVRYGRLLMSETNVETLPPENNTLLEEKFMGSVNTNGETYLQDRSDVTKHNDSSNSRCRKSSPRDSSRTNSNSTMDRGNVDKSNESLNLNNFDEDQGKERFGGSTHFVSTESLLEERADDDDFGHDRKVGESTHFGSMDSIFEKGADDDHVSDDTKIAACTNFGSMDSIFQEGANDDDSNRIQEITESMTFDSRDSLFEKRVDVDVEENNRMVESSEYHNKHRRSSSKTSIDIEDEVFYYLEKTQHRHGFSGSHIGDFVENTMLGKIFRKVSSKVGSEGLLLPLKLNAQCKKTTKKLAGRSSTPKHISTTNKRWVGFGVSNSAFNIAAACMCFVPVLKDLWIIIFISAASGSIVVVLLILLYLCIRGMKWSRTRINN
ncbi:hypothetical protein AK88_04185 [Plasmodium fragile]|uniref:Uncharacterized protein n=1 Tax=Plasmodium fragile TaxID=5857 RepID=A0A0D9QGT4_PLAFR|nr:uncharacterized protein AK88_04185 [Plasmodium fragile]KJP86214.1 hypothetical protein AK88_04185 [Plasmodium fragile]